MFNWFIEYRKKRKIFKLLLDSLEYEKNNWDIEHNGYWRIKGVNKKLNMEFYGDSTLSILVRSSGDKVGLGMFRFNKLMSKLNHKKEQNEDIIIKKLSNTRSAKLRKLLKD